MMSTKTTQKDEAQKLSLDEKPRTYRDVLLRDSDCCFKTKSGVLYIGVGSLCHYFFCEKSTDKCNDLSNVCENCYIKLCMQLFSHPDHVITQDKEFIFIPAEVFFDVATSHSKHMLCSDFWDVVDELKKVVEVKDISNGIIQDTK